MAEQSDLFEPAEYIQLGRPGYFTLGAKPGGRWQQHSYPVEHLPTVVNGVNPFHDSYITQAVFERPNRCIADVRDTALLFVDLDTYRSAGLVGKTPEELCSLLLLFCGQEGIPAPSIIMYSGRGLQAKWLLTSAVLRVDLHLWNQAQMALVRLLESFAADMASSDIARVLRLDKTVNTKSGEMCRILHVTGGVEGCPARYDFEELRLELCGEIQAQAPREVQRRASGCSVVALPHALVLKRLNWTRLEDLRTLVKVRGGIQEGMRELFLFWEMNFLLLADPGKARDIWNAAESLAREISPETFYGRSDLTTLYRKAKDTLNGEVVEFQGRALPKLYTPRNCYLIDHFRITGEEERGLRTIISQEEAYRRRIARRRIKGVAERVSRADKPWETLGISRAWWYRTRHE
jgi:hypothetical protein